MPQFSPLDLDPALAAFGLLFALLGVPTGAYILLRRIGHSLFQDDATLGWIRVITILYTRFFQRLTVEGVELVPTRLGPDGLIVVANHAAGIDPIAIQSQTRIPVRWMMSAEMMDPILGWMWRRMRVIPVTFDNRDVAALKTAIAHVSSGGALGIFPEGAIERPPRHLRPFSGGLRLILSRTRAPVLVAAIDPGRPTERAYDALWRPTHPKLRFLALIQPGPNGHSRDAAEQIFELLRERTGWPVTNAELPPPDRVTVDRNIAAYLSAAAQNNELG
jgi:1-acyl-sn-glycerol-3-phosphate acyltransferase